MGSEFISAIIALGVNIAVIYLGSYPEKFTSVNLFGFNLDEKIPVQSIFYSVLWILTVLNFIIQKSIQKFLEAPERRFGYQDSFTPEFLEQNRDERKPVTILTSEVIWCITTLFILLTIGSVGFILIILALQVLGILICQMCPSCGDMGTFINFVTKVTLIITGFFSIQMEAVNLFGFNLAAGFTKRSVYGTCLVVFASPSALISLVDVFQCGKSKLTNRIYIYSELISSIFYLIPFLTLGPLGFILSAIPFKIFVLLLKNCCADPPEIYQPLLPTFEPPQLYNFLGDPNASSNSDSSFNPWTSGCDFQDSADFPRYYHVSSNDYNPRTSDGWMSSNQENRNSHYPGNRYRTLNNYSSFTARTSGSNYQNNAESTPSRNQRPTGVSAPLIHGHSTRRETRTMRVYDPAEDRDVDVEIVAEETSDIKVIRKT
jgi:hypothetical protein